jgi:hypothetical protein
LIVLAGALAFAVTLQVSLAGVFRSTRPQVALAAAPLDAAARSKLAAQLVGAEPGDEAARRLAHDALRRDPLQPAALRVLGLTQSTDDAASLQRAAAFMNGAQRLSRRDLPTQMWLIEHYGRSGRVPDMVNHFDLALRSSLSARSAIFPLLTAAAADPRARDTIIRTLSRRPNWALPFATYSTDNGRDLDFAVTVAQLLLDPREAEDRAHYTTLLGRLVEYNRQDLAWDLYAAPKLGLRRAGAGAIRNGDFEATEDGTPFDWNYAEEPELWASRERVDRGIVLRVAAYNGRSGQVARQVLHLPAGPHRLRARVGDIAASEFERPELRIDCAGTSGDVLLLKVRPARSGAGPWELAGQFVVPPGCAFQQLSIGLSGEGALQEPSAWVDDIRID